MSLKARITEDMKAAMRAREASRLSAIRMLLAAIKQREVDERIELDDPNVIAVIEKMIKQRRESIAQFRSGAREDLAQAEEAEIDILRRYMPEALSGADLEALIDAAIAESGKKGIGSMGTIMAALKPRVAGRADMGDVSAKVKAKLSVST